ncbi:2-keto-4-pentenoate hydratase [Psychrobacillus sp. OK032]|uniref:2-keto-4-pentenoate hydratase n=1 Tax=Psychrobacillus sp. OK032 TaxID=1884358 RepID=UPI0008BEB384|nr:fumarylacetoacetate hydrolase family protein [Psychrobacillus sp. OK032]SER69420.1 2-oxo-3-hexenedioate decarboxylase [Psychrobacillus sp. OK032]
METITMESVVQDLFEAEKDVKTLPQFANEYPGMDENTAYDIQEKLVQKKCEEENTTVSGWKLGLTSKAKQQMMGVHEPSYGVLLKNMSLNEGESHSLTPFIHAKLEPELAFVFKKDVQGSFITPAQIMDATDYVVPAFEVIDSRFEAFKFTLHDAIADNSSSSRYILGNQFISPEKIDLQLTGIVFRKNGEVVATSTLAAVMGNPAVAIAWMANKIAKRNQFIRKGQVVLSGAITQAVHISPGDHFTATFDGLGMINTSFRLGE